MQLSDALNNPSSAKEISGNKAEINTNEAVSKHDAKKKNADILSYL